jgi:hypothetical protein
VRSGQTLPIRLLLLVEKIKMHNPYEKTTIQIDIKNLNASMFLASATSKRQCTSLATLESRYVSFYFIEHTPSMHMANYDLYLQ